MTNRLTEIRNATVDVLKQKFQRVYSGRGFVPAQSQLPCVVVYVDSRRTELEAFNSPPIYRQAARLITLVCAQVNISTDELVEEMLSVVQQVFVEHPDLGIDGLESLIPDLLNADPDDSGGVVAVYCQQGWQAVYSEQAV